VYDRRGFARSERPEPYVTNVHQQADGAEPLGTIEQPTLLVVAKDSPQPGYAEVTSVMAAAMPSARVEWIEGGHLINPAHPVVLGFVDGVLARQ
jgi:pimeloyl-ACP methyl ester carboxylesterase